jgi:hypothetical protein
MYGYQPRSQGRPRTDWVTHSYYHGDGYERSTASVRLLQISRNAFTDSGNRRRMAALNPNEGVIILLELVSLGGNYLMYAAFMLQVINAALSGFEIGGSIYTSYHDITAIRNRSCCYLPLLRGNPSARHIYNLIYAAPLVGGDAHTCGIILRLLFLTKFSAKTKTKSKQGSAIMDSKNLLIYLK